MIVTRLLLNYLTFQDVDFDRTWWKLFLRLVVCT